MCGQYSGARVSLEPVFPPVSSSQRVIVGGVSRGITRIYWQSFYWQTPHSSCERKHEGKPVFLGNFSATIYACKARESSTIVGWYKTARQQAVCGN